MSKNNQSNQDYDKFVDVPKKHDAVWVQVAPGIWVGKDGTHGEHAAAQRAEFKSVEARDLNMQGRFSYTPATTPAQDAQEGGE